MIGDLAHICNRGVDKRKIFNTQSDYRRFRDNLFLLNNEDGKIRTKHKNIFELNINLPKRKKLVEVLKWTLMPNHFHLLLYEISEGGILEFTKRLGNAYTKYFNLKNNRRKGYLFQNRARIISFQNERHFSYAPIYIDLNHLDLIKEDTKDKFQFLVDYEWSSLKNFYDTRYDDSTVDRGLFYRIFETDKIKYKKDLLDFIKNREDLEQQIIEYEEGVDLRG